MVDEATLPGNGDEERRTVTEGFFEQEVYLSREETAEFLHSLASQIESENRLTISSEDWEIPFEFDGPIEVEVEFAEKREKELEVEIEFTESRSSGGIDVS